MANTESILDSVKKNLGIDAAYTVFDPDILTHINSTFFTLNQLGLGPDTVFYVDNKDAIWADYIGTKLYLVAVKTYMFIKVKLAFDPPATSFAISALEKQATEWEWRLNVQREVNLDPFYGDGIPVNPAGPSVWDLTGLADFPPEAPIDALGVDYLTGQIWRKT